MPTRRPRVVRRTWSQRFVLLTGCAVVVLCGASATAAGYFGLRFAQIDRVNDIEIAAAAKGQPANYLLVGTDSREGLDPDAAGFTDDGQTGCDCTDTIMVLRVDPQAQEAHILSFPRDLWLPIAGTGETGRINSAHAHGEQVLIDTIQQSFGIPINHYVEIDFVGFEKLVNAVGGVPMWFDAPVRDKHTGLAVEAAECQVLDGDQARKFVRSRYLEYKGDDGKWHSDPTADLGRITRQQIFVRSAVAKAVGQGLKNPVTLNELVSAGVENVRLDGGLDAGDLVDLGRQFSSFDADTLQGYSIPSEPFRTAAGAQVERVLTRDAAPILNIFRGLPPGEVTPSAIELTVLNGTGIKGQAADVAGAFAAIGFAVQEPDTADGIFTRTVVRHGPGGEDAGRRVARHITGGATLELDPSLDPWEVVVVTGTDLTTVHDQPAAEGSAEDLAITSATTTTTPGAATGGEAGAAGSTTTASTTTTTEHQGYATGEPPPGVSCG
jgi:LCP family protein required for cell wall assembly